MGYVGYAARMAEMKNVCISVGKPERNISFGREKYIFPFFFFLSLDSPLWA